MKPISFGVSYETIAGYAVNCYEAGDFIATIHGKSLDACMARANAFAGSIWMLHAIQDVHDAIRTSGRIDPKSLIAKEISLVLEAVGV